MNTIKFIIFSILLAVSILSMPRLNVEASVLYKLGSVGEGVMQIQDALVKKGYLESEADGKYGSETEQAVKYFQQANGLVVDGIAGDDTLQALGLSTSDYFYEKEVMLLARLIAAEASGEDYIGYVAVGAVVVNRIFHEEFPDTLSDVIFQSGAFTTVRGSRVGITPSDISIKAARAALTGVDPTEGAIYFWNPKTATSKFIKKVPVTKVIGNHAFGIL